MKHIVVGVIASVALVACANTLEQEVTGATESASNGAPLCLDAGPQTPRDISRRSGTNAVEFPWAPASNELNLCNIHTHTNAEHKGPGFTVYAGPGDNGGYRCNDTASLTAAQLAASEGAYKGVTPGDTIEVHWVHSSCPVAPGEGLGACLTEGCDNPLLRVEAQVFLVVNDASAAQIQAFTDTRRNGAGFHQAKAIPSDTGEPVRFRGSTTGPSYTQSQCSPAQVTWNVRPQCKLLDINSLHRWAEQGNPFNETKSHGVRQLVTAPELLAPIP